MQQTDSHDADVFAITSTTPPLAYGLGIALAGVSITLWLDIAPFGVLSSTQRFSGGAVAFILAYILATFQRGTTVNRLAGTVGIWTRLGFVRLRKSASIRPHSVRLERSVLLDNDCCNPTFVHCIIIVNDGAPPVYVAHVRDAVRGAAIACNLAMFLGVALEDRTDAIEFRTPLFGFASWDPTRTRSRTKIRILPDGKWALIDDSEAS